MSWASLEKCDFRNVTSQVVRLSVACGGNDLCNKEISDPRHKGHVCPSMTLSLELATLLSSGAKRVSS